MVDVPVGRKIPYIDMHDPYNSKVTAVWLNGEPTKDHWIIIDARNGEGVRHKKGQNGEHICIENGHMQFEKVIGKFEVWIEDWEAPDYNKIPYEVP